MKLQSNNVSRPDKPATPDLSGSAETKLAPGESIDRFLEGRLRVIQSKDGYRFSIDAILLSEFVTIRAGDVVIDLGTGCGVILLSLLLKRPVGHAFGFFLLVIAAVVSGLALGLIVLLYRRNGTLDADAWSLMSG